MLTILATILGFMGPFVPEVIKFFNRKQDNVHELAVLELQAKNQENAAMHRMEEIREAGITVEQQLLHQQPISFGVQLLDAAKGWKNVPIWPAFYAFVFVDLVSALVRPVITYMVVGWWLAYKWAAVDLAFKRLQWQEALQTSWSENDLAVLMLCLGYYFGQRAVKAQFGGSASTGRAGGG